jgi:queuine tRNA-ribosyltransferase
MVPLMVGSPAEVGYQMQEGPTTSDFSLQTPHGPIALPAFFPDGTRGVVRAVDSADLAASGVAAVMVNALHLTTQPGADVVSRLGGLHGFMGWPGPIITDSGGYQIFSLLRENSRNGSVSAKGFIYRPGGGADKRLFTPEKSIQQQMRFGADILFCLDQCTHPADPREVQLASVERTIAWARQCKNEFSRRLEQRRSEGPRPLLFAVIQGGQDPDLRRRCADALIAIGFDGFGFGGWPINEEGELVDMVLRVAEMIPPGAPLHGLGIGKPENVVAAFRAGYHTCDSSFPTRAARRRQLMVATGPWERADLSGKDFYDILHIEDKKYYRDGQPLDPLCSCLTCRRYSRAYLHHLFRIDDGLANRLATLHNLSFYSRFIGVLREPSLAQASAHLALAAGLG